MSSLTYTVRRAAISSTRTWGWGAAGGVVAGVAMGLVMHFVMGAMPLIGALYGQPTVAAGWIAHLFHSIVFGLIFATAIASTSLRDSSLTRLIGLGAVYGIVLELVAAGVILPLWANAVGAAELPVPFLLPIGFATHLLYGVVLGAVFGLATVSDRPNSASMPREQPERPVR